MKNSSPIRDMPPCNGCARDIKRPGCHDHCPDFKKWRGKVDSANQKRKEYNEKPFVKII